MAVFFAGSDNAVVTNIAVASDAGMIKTAVHVDIHESGCVVAVIAFSGRLDVMVRFSDGQHTVVALAALSKHLQVISKAGNIKPEGGMAGLAHVRGGEVIRRFSHDRRIPAVVTIRALRFIGITWIQLIGMVANAGKTRAINGGIAGLDKRNDTLAGNIAGAHHQLHHVGSPGIGDEAGGRCGGVE